mmetsp:Transcript_4751/g.7804  ORF Transcript_4751/g.7804 Transcript_4751/m.7804 type:complete len:103 (+) Transcript_4751:705-1013(+)
MPGTEIDVIITPQCTCPTTGMLMKLPDCGNAAIDGPMWKNPDAFWEERWKQNEKASTWVAANNVESPGWFASVVEKAAGTTAGWQRPTMPEKCACSFHTAIS